MTGFIVGLETDANQRGLHKSGSTTVRNYFLVDDFKKTPRDLRRQILSLDPSTAPIFLLAKQGRAPGTCSQSQVRYEILKRSFRTESLGVVRLSQE